MTHFKSSNRNDGFSLIESVIYIALLAISLAALVYVFTSSMRTYAILSSQATLNQNKQVIERIFLRTLQQSTNVTVPTSGSGSILTLTMPDAQKNPTTFSVSNQMLTFKQGNGDTTPISTDSLRVTGFTVTRLSATPPAIVVSLTYEIEPLLDMVISSSSIFTYAYRYE